MNLELGGRVAWVLGASSGLGLGCASSLAREGARVAISARDPSTLEQAAASIRDEGGDAQAFPLDVTHRDAIAATAALIQEQMGPPAILVSNGGGPPPGPFEVHDDASLQEAFELTVASAWRSVKAVVPAMRAAGRGSIIFITSSSAKEVIPGLLLSNMMRPAVVGFAKTLSKELGPEGIRIMCVAPGRIDTARLKSLDELRAGVEGRELDELRADLAARIPLGRIGTPAEFGDLVAFLASERASYLTGITISVDGGALNSLLS